MENKGARMTYPYKRGQSSSPPQYTFEEQPTTMSYPEYKKYSAQARRNRNIVLVGDDEPTYDYFVGIDLGWVDDFTAMCVDEVKYEEVGKPFRFAQPRTNWDGGPSIEVVLDVQRVRTVHHIRHLDRVRGRKPALLANDIIERLITLAPTKGVFEKDEPPGIFVVIDATMDWAFINLLEAAAQGRANEPGQSRIEIHQAAIRPNYEHFHRDDETLRWMIPRNYLLLRGGRHPLEGEEFVFVNGKKMTVPKRKRSRIRWYKDIPYREVREDEYLSFVPVVNVNTDYMRFEPRRREGHSHDDLVFATSMAVMFGEEKKAIDHINLSEHKGEMIPWDPADGTPPPEPGSHTPITHSPLPPVP
jgi:hypothetical protein